MTASPARPAAAGPPPAGPGRFTRPPAAPGPSRARTFLAAVALLAVVTVVPIGLILLAGAPPVPRSLPTRAWLTQPVGMQQVVTVLVAVVWLAWLQFAVTVAVEFVAAVRGGVLAPPVPLAGPVQRLARTLVAALLLSAAVGTQVAAAAVPVRAPVSVSAVQSVAVAPAVGATGMAQPGAGRAVTGAVTHAREAAQSIPVGRYDAGVVDGLDGRKVYVVQPPQGRHHDSLWELAERHLGDGRRYREIYELNQGRPQPDGQHLHLARLIQPGWLLVMPDDAVGVARYAAPDATATLAPGVGATQGGGHGASAGEGAGSSGPAATQAGALAQDAGPGTATAGGLGSPSGPGDTPALTGAGAALPPQIALELGGAGLLAAGLLTAMLRGRRRRGPLPLTAEAVEAEVWLRVGADADRARWVNRALRLLGAACRHAGITPPGVYAGIADDDRLELLLGARHPVAPPPWISVDDGRTWRLDREASPRTTPEEVCPYPTLVSLGRDTAGRDVLLELGAAAGPISVTGGGQAEAVLAALVVELVTNPWSDRVTVTAADLPQALAALAGDRLVLTAGHHEAIERVRPGGLSGSDDLLSGRWSTLDGPVDQLVLGSPPVGAAERRVDGLGAGGVGVLLAGDVPSARWRLHLDDAGTLTVSELGLTVTANRLGPQTLARLGELLTPGTASAPSAPAGAGAGPDPGGSGRVPVPVVRTEADDAGWATAPARIAVLGAVRVRTPGALDPARVEQATELVAFLALHPGGVHPSVLAAAVWPRGVSADVRDATVERVRDWLGSDEHGSHRLRADADGRLSLGPDVIVDWDVLCSLLARSRAAADPAREADLLARALRLVRGPLAGGIVGGRYAWLARTGLEQTVPDVVADAAHRLAVLLGGVDHDGAGEAARAGLRIDPGRQELWRDLVRGEFAQWGVEGVRAVLADMQEVLADLGAQLDPLTQALIEELAPQLTGAASGTSAPGVG